jgi:hypothetical protein
MNKWESSIMSAWTAFLTEILHINCQHTPNSEFCLGAGDYVRNPAALTVDIDTTVLYTQRI